MTSKVQERRKALRETLVHIAQTQIYRDGVATLRARDLATQAGCALGAIYNVFNDLSDIIVEVNARSFDTLEHSIRQALVTCPDRPTDQLIAMSLAYHHYAAQNYHAWRALFDLPLSPQQDAPDWYRTRLAGLLTYIETPVQTLYSDLSPLDQQLLSKALFSSVHGIIWLGLDNANAGVPPDHIDRMIAMVLTNMTRIDDPSQ